MKFTTTILLAAAFAFIAHSAQAARRGEFRDLIVDVYAKTFPTAAVDPLLVFHTSAMGRKVQAASTGVPPAAAALVPHGA